MNFDKIFHQGEMALISVNNRAMEYKMSERETNSGFGLSRPCSLRNSLQSAAHFLNSESVIPAAMDKGSL